MDRLIAPNTVVAGQADTAPTTGTPGYATDGNPAIGVLATLWPSYQYNAIQEELIAILTAAGITPDRTKTNQIVAAIRRLFQNTVVLADTGAANTYIAVNATPLVAGTWVDGVVQAIKIAHTNTGASTYAPDGLTAIPVYGLALQPLQGGELFAGGTAILMHATIAGVNSGSPICVLMECAGGAQQIAPATASQHAVQLGQVGNGQCRLSVTNSTTLTLMPHGGNIIIIGGVPRQVPSAGVTASNAGTNPNTLYYIYASWGGGGNMVLSPFTTGHVTNSNGIEVKSDDPSFSLVGAVYTNASDQFVDSSTARYCINWFNRRNLNLSFDSISSYTFSNTSFAEITTALRLSFITWADECVAGGVDGEMANSTASQSIVLYSTIDGVQFGPACGVLEVSASGGQSYSSHFASTFVEGFHTASIYGEVTGGTGTLATAGIAYTIRG